jgi:Tfp pilus assembly protein PilF/cold shock CspA family protein
VFNPLAIKWFVQSVRAGGRPDKLLSDQKLVLKFCIENVLDKLSSISRETLNAFVITSRPQTISSLHFILERDVVDLARAVRELRAANLLIVTPSRDLVGDDQYKVTQIGNLYIRNYFAPNSAEVSRIRSKQQQLCHANEHSQGEENGNIYNPNFVYLRRDHDDYVTAEYLRGCMRELHLNNVDGAEEYLRKATDMAPNYFEVYRVEAFLAFKRDNVLRAENAYDRAISLRPDHAPLRRWYGGFLLRINEFNRAKIQLEKAIEIDPKKSVLRLELARVCVALRLYEPATEWLNTICLDDLNFKERKQLLDVWLNLYSKQIEEKILMDELDSSFERITKLDKFLETIDHNLIDDKHIWSLSRISRSLRGFNSQERGGERGAYALSVIKKVYKLMKGSEGQQIPQRNGDVREGYVKSVIKDKKYGFITEDTNGTDWFFHRKSMIDISAFPCLQENTRVLFEVGQNDQGQCAVNVEVRL